MEQCPWIITKVLTLLWEIDLIFQMPWTVLNSLSLIDMAVLFAVFDKHFLYGKGVFIVFESQCGYSIWAVVN